MTSSPSRRQVGAEQETRALEFLEKKGWTLLKRNYASRSGEVDLIFRDGEGTIVFVEVKFRSRPTYGSSQEMVNWSKQRRVAKAALLFVKERKLMNHPLRFDVVALSPKGAVHIPNAFSPEGYSL